MRAAGWRARRVLNWGLVRAAPAWVLRRLLSLGPASSQGHLQTSPFLPQCTKAEAGIWGEEIAARYLRALGMRLLGRNLEAPEGELDLVALDGPSLVVIEVKTGWCPLGPGGRPPDHRPGDHFHDSDARRRRRAAARMARADGLQPRVDLVEVLAGRGRLGVEIVHSRGVY